MDCSIVVPLLLGSDRLGRFYFKLASCYLENGFVKLKVSPQSSVCDRVDYSRANGAHAFDREAGSVQI
jgi:hypothetical protein